MPWTNAAGVMAMAQQAVAALESHRPNALLLEGLALALFGRAVGLCEEVAPFDSGEVVAKDPRMLRVVGYIEAHLDEDVSISALAAVACLSPHHLRRAFRDGFGEPPHAYVRRRRMARARAMLEEGTAPIAEIALVCGFASQSHLTSVVRQTVGVAPGAYRRAHAGRAR